MPCKVTIIFDNDSKLQIEKKDYEGFRTRPASWNLITQKVYNLTSSYNDKTLLNDIIDTIRNIEHHQIGELMKLLEKARPSSAGND